MQRSYPLRNFFSRYIIRPTAYIAASTLLPFVISVPTSFGTAFEPTKSTTSLSFFVAKNLPDSNGASSLKRGTLQALAPIKLIRTAFKECEASTSSSGNTFAASQLKLCQDEFAKLPGNEKEFKRIFDEYSEGISYKQRYLDSNAFLVYYSKGFDGVNRPSIETGNNKLHVPNCNPPNQHDSCR
jgi:hypothetical protein